VLVEPDSEFTDVLVEPESEFTTELVEPESEFTTELVEPESELTTELVEPESKEVAVERETKAAPSTSASITLSDDHTALRLLITVLSEESVTATAVVKTGLTSLATLLICVCRGVFLFFLNHFWLELDLFLLVDFLVFFLADIVLVGLVGLVWVFLNRKIAMRG